MNIVAFLIQQTMFFSIPLLIVALGGMYSERSGVVNIALEGIMIMGAFVSMMVLSILEKTMQGQGLLLIVLLVAALSGMLYSFLHAYASINMKANQVISGTALNMFAPAFAIFVARIVQGYKDINFNNTFRIESVPLLGKIPIIGPMFFQNAYITTYLGVGILILSAVILYKTKFGLRLRACGEHPQAADSVGVNVYKMRYAGVLISGALAGVGGLIYVIPTSTSFSANVSGYGFLALAVLIFGQWKPYRILLAAFFFGFMKTVSAAYSGIPFLRELEISGGIYKMIPYIITLVVLAVSSKKSQAPKAAGIPYDVGKR